jgi:benzoyl-CoA reductase/2-hydroxyglutaryl-CoA dehydratase subunit BcrC/BadD/HgdB
LDTELQSKALREFSEATEAVVNPSIQAWKKRGGKVIGYFCSGVPEELIMAAGFLPLRMRATGSTGTELSDVYYSSINCSFPRHCFNMALRGEFDFLDGLICMNTCDHVRRIYDNWKVALKTPFIEILSFPRKSTEVQVGWYKDELTLWKQRMEEHFAVEVGDEDLWQAIRLTNEKRRLQRQLYELRKAESPPITGAESLAVMVAGTAMPAERYNGLLRELLGELRQSTGSSDYRARLMVIGGILDDPAYMKVLEEQGGLVVTDSSCFGTRIMWEDVDENASDPITALARYYVADRPSCPRMYGDQPKRAGFISNMIRDFKVDGAIGEQLKFCDNWIVEHYMNELDFKESGVPFLKLEREYIVSGVGQLRTRVQAFIETMGK